MLFLRFQTYPSQWQTDNNVQPSRHEKASKVVNAAGSITQQDAVANDTDGAKYDAEQPATLRAVRDEGRGHVRRSTEKVARHGEELNLGCRPVAEIIDDCGKESRVACVLFESVLEVSLTFPCTCGDGLRDIP